jgi:hypothetical protein
MKTLGGALVTLGGALATHAGALVTLGGFKGVVPTLLMTTSTKEEDKPKAGEVATKEKKDDNRPVGEKS